MAFAIIFGWTIVLGGAVFAAALWVWLLRVAMSVTNASSGPAWIAMAATIAATCTVSVACRLAYFRITTTHEGALPYILAAAAISSAALAWLLPAVLAAKSDSSGDIAFKALCTACVLAPVALWAFTVIVPSLRESERNDIRSQYERAEVERDTAVMRRLRAENPWLREELDHQFDGTETEGGTASK